MPWYSKEQSTPFDSTEIEGLEFLSGAVLAEYFKQERLRHKKYPLIQFPSGLTREMVDTDQGRAVHIYGALALPQAANRDEAYTVARHVAEDQGYQLAQQGDDWLIVLNPYSGRGCQVRYDNASRQLADVTHFPQEAMELVPGEIRAALPPLYSNEKRGMAAIAPVKYFTPDSGWSWYPTEFDGEDTFFGLASGFEVELGYFSLTELEGVRGPLGLPIERDLWYEPQTLRQLKTLEEKLKGL
jgi:hypothetical protein